MSPHQCAGRPKERRAILQLFDATPYDWDLEVVGHVPGTKGFAVRPKRWIVERTFGRLSRYRRMSKDYERKVQTSETLMEIAIIRLLVARLGRKA
jgi:putative transposase